MPMSPRLLRPRARGGFSPTSISGLNGWFDASDVSSMAQSSDGTTAVSANGDPVGFLRNKAGGTNATQSVSTARRPTYRLAIQNGRSVLRFDGSDDELKLSLALEIAGNTWILVSTPVSSADGYLLSADGANNTGPAIISGFLSRSYEWFNGAGDRNTIATTLPGVNVITATFVDLGAVFLRRNGTAVLNFTSGASISGRTLTTIGSAGAIADNAAFDFCELVTFSRVLSGSELQTVERWLGGKWGVTVA